MLFHSFLSDAGLFTIASADAEPSDLIVNLGNTLKMLFMLNEIVTAFEADHVTPKSVT